MINGISNGSDLQAILKNMQNLAAGTALTPLSAGPESSNFEAVLTKVQEGLKIVSDQQKTADYLSERFVQGDGGVNLVDVMVESHKAKVLFQATTEVRDKLLAAYKEIWNMGT